MFPCGYNIRLIVFMWFPRATASIRFFSSCGCIQCCWLRVWKGVLLWLTHCINIQFVSKDTNWMIQNKWEYRFFLAAIQCKSVKVKACCGKDCIMGSAVLFINKHFFQLSLCETIWQRSKVLIQNYNTIRLKQGHFMIRSSAFHTTL